MKKIKYLRVFSDIHLDFDVNRAGKDFVPERDLWFPKQYNTDKETILVIAGDIWHASKPFDFKGYSWIKELSNKFLAIIVVLGNHDLWGGTLIKEYENFNLSCKKQGLNNVFLLQNNIVRLGDVKFVGGTLWTGYDRANMSCMKVGMSRMNDFEFIHYSNPLNKISAENIFKEHEGTYKHIRKNRHKEFEEQKVWVITHHAPSFRSLYQNNTDLEGKCQEDCSDASNLENLITDDISVWVHGHIHKGNYYKIKNTKIISNPRGYHGENKLFKGGILLDSNGNILRLD